MSTETAPGTVTEDTSTERSNTAHQSRGEIKANINWQSSKAKSVFNVTNGLVEFNSEFLFDRIAQRPTTYNSRSA